MAHWHHLYKQLWNHRSFYDIEEAMRGELQDEASHPRTRKQPEAKFLEAVRRVEASQLSDQEKMTLISAYIACIEKIQKQKL